MEVNITKRIDTPDGRRFCKVIFTPNGRIKPDWVEVDDRQERHPEGVYHLDWTEDGQRKRMAVGSGATAAYNSLKKKQSEFDAIARGLVVTDPMGEEDNRLRLRAAKAEFLDDIQHIPVDKVRTGHIDKDKRISREGFKVLFYDGFIKKTGVLPETQ